MNYRHAFHAGNHADVFKHLALSRMLSFMSRKEAPLAYLDTHAGVGLYDLMGDSASRTGEWLEGIGRIWARFDQAPAAMAEYLEVIAALNTDGALRYYPGSPELMRRLSRPQDRLYLNEKHPDDGALLRQNMAGDRRVAVHQGDGWLVPRALLPTREKRVLLLIDPPFEQGNDLERAVQALDEIIGRMRQAVVAIWYPIKDERQLKRFYTALSKSKAPTLMRAELYVNAPDDETRLNGSGLVISNPPWGLEDDMRSWLPWLATTLAQSQGSSYQDWLIAEKG